MTARSPSHRPRPNARPRRSAPRLPAYLRPEASPQAPLALENARLHEAEQQARERVERLQQVSAALSRAATPAAIGAVVVGEGLRLLGGDTAVLFLAAEGGQSIELVAHDGLSEEVARSVRSLPLASTTPTARAFFQGKAVFIESAEEYERAFPESAVMGRSLGVAAFTSIPLRDREGERLGVATVGYRHARRFSPADRAFLLALAELCAQALERARLFEAERRLRAAAEEANRLKDEFLATVSHELRTPLTAILGWAAMLRDPRAREPDAARKAAEIIERNARAQARLIDDILDVSRVLTGKLRLEPAPVDFGALVREAVETVRHAAAAKRLDVGVRTDAGPHRLFGDLDRLRQIAWNLLSNALRYTDRGGHVLVELRRLDRQLELRVTDDGRGIDPAFLPYVFDRFRQQDGSTTRQHGGLGLGLAIVRQMVELHGGTVSAESPGLGLGATFVVSLPADVRASTLPPAPPLPACPSAEGPASPPLPASPSAEGPTSPALPASPSAEGPSYSSLRSSPPPEAPAPRAVSSAPSSAVDANAPLAGRRVLVVDDDADARDLFEAIFSSAGASVCVASSAEAALDALDAFPPDVLVADIGMPERDGYSLLRAVRALPDALAALPAVAITAYAHPEDVARALSAGYQRHVAKPVDPPRLIEAVCSVLGRSAPP